MLCQCARGKLVKSHAETGQVGLANDVYGAKEIFIRLIADIRAQEQAKIDAKAAAEAERKKVDFLCVRIGWLDTCADSWFMLRWVTGGPLATRPLVAAET